MISVGKSQVLLVGQREWKMARNLVYDANAMKWDALNRLRGYEFKARSLDREKKEALESGHCFEPFSWATK